MKSTDKPIVIEENFKVSLNQIWVAITELKQMRQWFFNELVFF